MGSTYEAQALESKGTGFPFSCGADTTSFRAILEPQVALRFPTACVRAGNGPCGCSLWLSVGPVRFVLVSAVCGRATSPKVAGTRLPSRDIRIRGVGQAKKKQVPARALAS